jgi:uncharacterized Ntn-hydrolase superfamily protein
MRTIALVLLILCVLFGASAQNSGVLRDQQANPFTCSLLAKDPETGDLGLIVLSRSMAVGAVVPSARAGVGVVATLGKSNAQFGVTGLEMLSRGMTSREVVDSLLNGDPESSKRQLGVVDANGTAFGFTGSGTKQYAGQYTGNGFVVLGNGLSSEGFTNVIARTFEATPGDLAERMLTAMEAGEKAGGARRGTQSAALVVVRKEGGSNGTSDRYIDLRIDQDSSAIGALRRLYGAWNETYLGEARMRTIEAFRRDKNFSAAEQELQRLVGSMNSLLRDKPDDPAVLNQVAWTLATNGIDPPRALELAKRAATLSPGNLSYLHTLAQCHFAAGHLDEAIAIEAELVQKEPANDDFWKQLQRFKEAKSGSGR